MNDLSLNIFVGLYLKITTKNLSCFIIELKVLEFSNYIELNATSSVVKNPVSVIVLTYLNKISILVSL